MHIHIYAKVRSRDGIQDVSCHSPMMNALVQIAILLPLLASSVPLGEYHPQPDLPETDPGTPNNPQKGSHAKALWEPLVENEDFHLNPDWTPDVNNYAPISIDGINPWNDNGRSQMDVFLSHLGPWSVCPQQYLNCELCREDFRCNPSFSPTTNPSLTPDEQPQSTGEEEFGALTGPQLSGSKSVEAMQHRCSLQTCSDEGGRQCGSGATCENGYCACPQGIKGSGNVTRRWNRPDALMVYLNPSMACNLTCDNLLFSEVPREEGCEEPPVQACEPVEVTQLGSTNETLEDTPEGATEPPAIPAYGGLGAIHAPGGGGGDGDRL